MVNGHLGEVCVKISREPGGLLKVGKQELQAAPAIAGSSTRGTAIVLIGQIYEACIQALRALLIAIGDFHKIRQRVVFQSSDARASSRGLQPLAPHNTAIGDRFHTHTCYRWEYTLAPSF